MLGWNAETYLLKDPTDRSDLRANRRQEELLKFLTRWNRLMLFAAVGSMLASAVSSAVAVWAVLRG